MEYALPEMSPAARFGRWWFQWRGFSPLPLFILVLILPPNFRISSWGLVAVALGIVAAEALRVWAVGFAGSATRTRGDRVPGLVHAGPFRHVRNPLYIANTAMYTLVGVAFGFSWLSLGIAVYSSVQYAFIVAFEEQILRGQFGSVYEAYCARVSRWWPALSPRIAASEHRFNLGAALRSERSTLLALAVLTALFFLRR